MADFMWFQESAQLQEDIKVTTIKMTAIDPVTVR